VHPAWLDRLEREAAERLDGRMLSFSGGEYACPWLRWYLRRHRNRAPEVVVILQDWGLGHGERVSIDAAVKEISSPGGNQAMLSIFSREMTSNGLLDGSLCVLTAAWGLRLDLGANQRADLKKAIHAAAWPIWATALRKLSPTKLIVTTGYWTVDYADEPTADGFLEKWANRVAFLPKVPRFPGVAHEHWDHPGLWKK